MMASWWKKTPSLIALPKKSNWSLIKPLDLAANFQEIQSTEKHIQSYHRDAIRKMQKSTWQIPQLNYKEKEGMERKLVD